ncbi:MAG: GNAT family N-acetyltransferase [Anaerolineae bacterium]|nr:GNAT family N-acetyltransferase [Anaerolineae bacterium]
MTFIMTGQPERAAWQRFVAGHPDGNIFHTPAFDDVAAGTEGWASRPLAAVDRASGELMALWPAVHTTVLGGLLRPLTTRAVLFGGMLVAPEPAGQDALDALLAVVNRRAWGRSLFTELRHQADVMAWQARLEAAHFRWEPHLNFLIDLRQSEEALWNGLSSSARRNVRTAQKKGVSALTVSDQAGVETFYGLLRKVYGHAGVYLTDLSLFRRAFEVLGPLGQFQIVLAMADGVAIGGRASLLYKGRLLDWYAGADREAARLYPNDFLVWHLLQWGHAQGFSVFDFGGAGHPDKPYGVRDFKERFGGQLVNYGRSVKIHAPWYGLAVKAYEIYRKWIIQA